VLLRICGWVWRVREGRGEWVCGWGVAVWVPVVVSVVDLWEGM